MKLKRGVKQKLAEMKSEKCKGSSDRVLERSDLQNPVNMNTDRPAPNPKYTKTIPTGFPNFSMFAIFESVNITIWNGTIIENRQR